MSTPTQPYVPLPDDEGRTYEDQSTQEGAHDAGRGPHRICYRCGALVVAAPDCLRCHAHDMIGACDGHCEACRQAAYEADLEMDREIVFAALEEALLESGGPAAARLLAVTDLLSTVGRFLWFLEIWKTFQISRNYVRGRVAPVDGAPQGAGRDDPGHRHDDPRASVAL